jgi:tetratricopeptide (TPR) repeat protein
MSYYNLGKVYQKQRKWDKAIEQFEQAAQRQPTNENFQYDLGEAYFQVKKLDNAEKAFEAATNANPKLFKGWWYLGMIRKLLDHPKEADEALRKSIEVNPRFAKSFVALGYLYLDYDFNKEAAQVFQGCVTGQGRRRRVPQRLRPGAQEPQAVRAGDGRVQEGDRPRSGSLRRPLQRRHGLLRLVRRGPRERPEGEGRDYLQKFVTNGGKSADGNYVKAANDKLYALSGP